MSTYENHDALSTLWATRYQQLRRGQSALEQAKTRYALATSDFHRALAEGDRPLAALHSKRAKECVVAIAAIVDGSQEGGEVRKPFCAKARR